MIYSIPEQVEIITPYFQNNSCARLMACLFNERHPDKNVSNVYVGKLVTKFVDTGSVCNRKHQPQKPIRNEVVEVAVLGHVGMDHSHSTRQLAEASGVYHSSILRILKAYHFHPYQIQLVHALNEDDPDRRLQFCEAMIHRLLSDPQLLFNICFFDECTFYLHGAVNRHNCRYWDDSNPHLFREVHTQYPQKLNVCCGILGNHIMGPLFIPENLTDEVYLNMLEDTIDRLITQIIEDDQKHTADRLHFQQDGAPPHYVIPVRQFLDDRFPRRWIGRRGSTEWPAKSPVLSMIQRIILCIMGFIDPRLFSSGTLKN